MRKGRRLQNGQRGEIAAEAWFIAHGWKMVRTQPAIQILDCAPGSRYGHIFSVRMVGKGGIPDYTGYEIVNGVPHYRAVEVKEATGSIMPASRLKTEQRAFMSELPNGCAFVGILWTDYDKFEIYHFKPEGSYKKGGEMDGEGEEEN